MAASISNASLPPAVTRSHTGKFSLGRLLAWGFLFLWVLITLFPVYWMFRVAFSTQRELLANPTSLLPVHFTLDAFKRVLGLLPLSTVVDQGGFPKILNFGLYLRNTFIVALVSTVGSVAFSTLAAYAFARLRFPFRNQLFYIYIATLIMPTVLNMIPNFILIYQLHWIGTLPGIIAPAFLGNAFSVFFLRQFFLGLNRELEEAARLDGAGLIGVFWHIALPLSLPAVTTLAILSFMGAWNDFQWPYFAGGQGRIEEATTLTMALAYFRSQQQSGIPDFTGMMAGAILGVAPMLALFAILGRRIVNSIQFSGIK